MPDSSVSAELMAFVNFVPILSQICSGARISASRLTTATKECIQADNVRIPRPLVNRDRFPQIFCLSVCEFWTGPEHFVVEIQYLEFIFEDSSRKAPGGGPTPLGSWPEAQLGN
jgi:hypothetical protein